MITLRLEYNCIIVFFCDIVCSLLLHLAVFNFGSYITQCFCCRWWLFCNKDVYVKPRPCLQGEPTWRSFTLNDINWSFWGMQENFSLLAFMSFIVYFSNFCFCHGLLLLWLYSWVWTVMAYSYSSYIPEFELSSCEIYDVLGDWRNSQIQCCHQLLL